MLGLVYLEIFEFIEVSQFYPKNIMCFKWRRKAIEKAYFYVIFILCNTFYCLLCYQFEKGREIASSRWEMNIWLFYYIVLLVLLQLLSLGFVLRFIEVLAHYYIDFIFYYSESARQQVMESIIVIPILPVPSIPRIFDEFSMIVGTLYRECTYGNTNYYERDLGAYCV